MGTQTSPDKFINKTLNSRYQIARILGIGALGTVYLAKDTRINKNVAVKVLTGSVSNDDIKRFKRECNFLASFNHLNIVGVFDHDVTAMEENNYYFLVMEYVNGVTLKEFLKTSDSLPLEDKLNIACQICNALNAVHEKQIIHRDLKPENIMITTGNNDHLVKLLDFGISKSLSQDSQSNTTNITKSGTVGTPRHMSPEQLHHEEKPITYSSDIYSLGIVFYEILSKQHPLINNGEIDVPDFRWISKHLTQSPRPLSTICPDLPTNLAGLVMDMLAKEPTNRPSLDIIRNVLSNPSQSYKNLSPFTFETVKVNAKGRVIERKKKQARQYIEHLGNGVILEMVEIPAGEFMMGTSESDIEKVVTEYKRYGWDEKWIKTELPQHKVKVEMFYIGKYQVTQEQWKEIMGDNPSYFKEENNLPVENVSWEDCSKFCKKLSEKTGKEYRLASEAEWEYACRAGSETPFAYGETINTEIVNYDGNYPYGEAPKGEYRDKTTPVGSLGVANEFGLYDMHGNVWEWCQDEWHDNYNNAPTDGSTWENISSNNTSRVLRGGSCSNGAGDCRSAARNGGAPDGRYDGGLRVVRSARTLK